MCNKIKRKKCCKYDGCERGLGQSNRSGLCYYHYKVTYIRMRKKEVKGESLNTVEVLPIQDE